MKKFLQIFFVLLSVVGFSQTPPNGWQDLSFTVTGGDCDLMTGGGEIFISEVYDHSSGSFAAVELYNPTNASILLSNYSLRRTSDYGDGNWVAAWNAVTAAMIGRSIPANSTFLIYLGTSNFGCSQNPDISNTDSFTGLNANDQIQLLKGGLVIDDWRAPINNFYSMVRRPNAEVPKAVFNSADWITSGPDCSNLNSHTIDPTTPPEIKFIVRRPDSNSQTFNQCLNTIQIRMDQNITGYVYRYNLQGTTTPINVVNNTSGTFSNLPLDTFIMTISVRRSTASTVEICTIEATFTLTGGIQTSPIILLNP